MTATPEQVEHYQSLAAEAGFAIGQSVVISPCYYDLSSVWEGEIVSYWRNGAWIVRELVHGTTVAIDIRRIAVRP